MISYIRGYYTILANGIGIEKFLNYLIRNNIKVYNVKRLGDTKIQFNVSREDFKEFKKIYKGSSFDVKVKQKVGLPFIMITIYKNKMMWIGAIISLFILMATSQFVTDVHIQVPEGIKIDELREELYSIGLKPGINKKDIDRKNIRDEIMIKFNDIAYISINVKGTNVFVTVTKKAETLESKEDSNFCNVIATKNGIIEEVIARSGTTVVKEGDIVKAGDVLVTGANTKSPPEIWASTFYEVVESDTYNDSVKEKTGKKKNVFTLKFYDEEFTIRRNIGFNNYIIENNEYEFSFGNYTFPLKVEVSTFYESIDTSVEKDKEKLKVDLKEKAMNELNYIIPPSARYRDVKDAYKVDKDMLKYTLTVQTSENIADIYPLTKAEAEKLILEQNQNEEEIIPSNPEKRPTDDIRNEFDDKIKEDTNEETNDQ
ncbi:MAG: sporulation protein YqfD [Peptostreptococcaceae bacterium]